MIASFCFGSSRFRASAAVLSTDTRIVQQVRLVDRLSMCRLSQQGSNPHIGRKPITDQLIQLLTMSKSRSFRSNSLSLQCAGRVLKIFGISLVFLLSTALPVSRLKTGRTDPLSVSPANSQAIWRRTKQRLDFQLRRDIRPSRNDFTP